MAQTDKLALFVEDIRRAGVECLPPDINASRADFSVEDGKVRYALGALKGVGEKAMESLVAEREANGPFQVARRFRRPDRPAPAQPPPDRKPGGRRRFRRARTRPRRGVRRRRDHPRPCRQRRRQREQRPAGLFGGDSRRGSPPIRLPRDASWTLAAAHGGRARRFRFLFLGPPGRRPTPFARRPQGADLRRAWPRSPSPRASAPRRMMAGLVEGARWRARPGAGAT